ncbi:hypothetical protein PSPPH_0930 [Pseudomonas savastanoi pv. phaseolicola 1448A]|uniref:Uncharacterized protein n=3 Tax=Pseudomonas savastanoi TaxID=29438 RepID=A0A3M6DZD2_PSESG|nr:hypothetical protein PSPPH_0930 [Pseudomonas savastanoi pv. phaseolicola 1448A]KPY11727.1 hypothetical protein ALO55_101666 [Pseudomonas savastanoi pv. phaseolicola]RMM62061.1 hypothetical protein ALQ73_101372 [Pseudomonas savastanoi pv. glycinea]RMM66930.1 hypothetical protein ALQ74_101796 [Pseudomonas savastanoi pv. glycinea]RMQ49614.1 hypothetical protein ALQ02_101443 [Pseudomonas savastanoi pv. phaseolicola]
MLHAFRYGVINSVERPLTLVTPVAVSQPLFNVD